MGLLGENKKKDEGSEDTLKVLATNIETINQRLAMTSPEFGFAEYQESVKKNLESIWNQLGTVANMVKTTEMGLRQSINYGLSQNENMLKQLKENELAVKKHLEKQKEEIAKSLSATTEEIQNTISQYGLVTTKLAQDLENFQRRITSRISMINENIQRNIQAAGSTSSNVLNEVGNLKNELHSLLSDFNKGMSQNIQKSGNVDPNLIKEMKNLKQSMRSIIGDFTENIRPAPPSISPIITDEINALKDEMNNKLNLITEVLRDLVNTNREYVHYLKE